jgi:hypothetical protein
MFTARAMTTPVVTSAARPGTPMSAFMTQSEVRGIVSVGLKAVWFVSET